MTEGAPTPALEVRGLSKTFGAHRALSELDLTIAAGEVHCLVGENGSGKSTLIKILSAYHDPDAGSEIIIGGRVFEHTPGSAHKLGCRFVHQDLGLVHGRSVLDNLGLGSGYPTRAGTIRRRAARAQARADLERLNLAVDPDVALETLSAAERTGVAIARALHDDSRTAIRLLVLDEPTATLPINDVGNLLKIVREVARAGVSVLYVTHRLDEIFQIGDRVSVLRDGRLAMTAAVGDVSRERIVAELTGQPAVATDEPAATASTVQDDERATVLSVASLVSPTLDCVSFSARTGEIVGIAGITGSGRETVLSTVFGARSRVGGTVSVANRQLRANRPDLSIANGMAYLPVDRAAHGGVADLTGRENLMITDVRRHWNRLAISRKRERADARTWFDSLEVRPRRATEQPLSLFSGGNQQKILFGKWLRRAPKVFLLDEPTQGVDIRARERLHQLLRAAAADGTAVIVSSTDINELASLCDRVLVMSAGRVATEVVGPSIDAMRLSRTVLTVSSDRSGVHA